MKTKNIYPIFLSIWLILITLTGPGWAKDDWQRVEKEIDQESIRADQDAALTERLVSKARSEMKKEVTFLRNENSRLENRHKTLIKQY